MPAGYELKKKSAWISLLRGKVPCTGRNRFEPRVWQLKGKVWAKFPWISLHPGFHCWLSLWLVQGVNRHALCKQLCWRKRFATYHQTSHLFFNTLCWKTLPPPPHQQSPSPGSSQPHFQLLQTLLQKPPTETRPLLRKPLPDGLWPSGGDWAGL